MINRFQNGPFVCGVTFHSEVRIGLEGLIENMWPVTAWTNDDQRCYHWHWGVGVQVGGGVLKRRLSISPLEYHLNHVHICQVSPQQSCGDTCHKWTWYSKGTQCFDNYEIIEQIMEREKLP